MRLFGNIAKERGTSKGVCMGLPRHRYGSIGTIKASTPYEVRWGYCTVPSVRGPLCVEFRDNFQLLVSNLNCGQERDTPREPDPTHNELKHTTTRKTETHERTPEKPHVHTHTHTSRTENDAQDQQTSTPPRITAEHTLTLQPPPRASALASGTIACASSTDPSASASARCLPCRCTAGAPAPPRRAGPGGG